MELTGNGLNKGSHMYFYTPSQTAEKLLYYPIAAGEFYCNDFYIVERERYDSFLALYVLDGNMTIYQNEKEISAQKDELLLIDCYKPHKYFCSDNAYTLWVHFDGNNSRQWFNEITAQRGLKTKCSRQTADCILNIIKYIMNNRNEYDISAELYSMLCFASKSPSENESRYQIQVEKAKDFIISNYNRAMSLDEIAGAFHMSVSYFSKIFRETAGFSPYDYLLSVRLDKAKEMLLQTDYSVESIAYKTGFNSTANFIYFFKKKTGTSPLKFRNIKF